MSDKTFFYKAEGSADILTSGPLNGLRVVIQPNLLVEKWPTEAGSRALEKFISLEDASVIKFLRKSSARIIGSTYMSELGLGIKGETTSTALTNGSCDAALVTDTMGEARHIAVKAGCFAFKPSYGICSRWGLIGLVPSMECLGVVSPGPDIAGKVLAAMAVADPLEFSMLWDEIPDFRQAGLIADNVKTVGVIHEALELVDEKEREAFQTALEKLRTFNVEIKKPSFPDFNLCRKVHHIVGAVEASSSAGKYDGVRYGHRAPGTDNWNEMYLKSRGESFGEAVKSYLFQGAYFQFKNYAAFENACRLRNHLVKLIRNLFTKVDVLALPTTRLHYDATRARTITEIYDAFSLTLLANLCGLPAVNISNWLVLDGKDLGLQIVAPHLADLKLLNFTLRLSNK